MLKVDPIKYWTDLPALLEQLPHDKIEGTHPNENGLFTSAAFDTPEGFPATYKNIVNHFIQKYNAYDFQVFCTLGKEEGFGWHKDPQNVLICALYGHTEYGLSLAPGSEEEHFITIKPNDLLSIPIEQWHKGMGDYLPRIILSMATPEEVPEEDVQYHFYNIVGV